MNHRARITLQTRDIFNIDQRIAEVGEIKDWLDAQVNWQPDQYELKFLASCNAIDVWFTDERHATMCKLRWL
jgi:hypothetical protein